ncbi:hypothetical protein A1O1_05182 [Capronia coronata CBS 617.96]|uniref:Uncharacterized protein n=1 Tax=Capronia coronata CBS 617.96 TaxID=1182541 RepID=W9Y5Z2_9EURO|nr:uncharacterized protein A1O1_05182 [Capronia coronata CBS 617.96]EXJ88252.1 hypothetical protein A1O1_05182 [Capronia coronata CBS 617.96]
MGSGAANIAPDDTPYADGEIVREGPVGDQGDGPYSAGRGGAGNIVADGEPAAVPHDAEVIPETATRISREESHHVGRGGAGNEAHVQEKKQEGLADKLKHFFFKKKS